jgi:hypothetical protein
MYGRSRAEREWMADVAAQMIRDELLDDEDEEQEPARNECARCNGCGMFEDGSTCFECEGTGLVDED